mgnify:FL=1
MRRRYVRINDVLTEVPLNWTPDDGVSSRVAILGDKNFHGLKATDGADISTRTKHREYMKRNGFALIDDYRETFKKAEEKRIEAKRGIDPSRKEDIARAIANPRKFGWRG